MMQSKKSGDVPPANQIWYDAASQVTLYTSTWVTSHTFSNGRGVVTFDRDITNISYHWLRTTPVTTVYLPNTITRTTTYAFSNCKSLKSIAFPAGMVTINSNCLSGCSKLTTVIIHATTPPQIYTTTFPAGANFYVPANSVDAYKAADIWSTYASRIFAIPE